jgi:hypothetical protein
MMKELAKMEEDLKVYHSVKASSLSPSQRKAALHAVNMVIKEK